MYIRFTREDRGSSSVRGEIGIQDTRLVDIPTNIYLSPSDSRPRGRDS